MQAMTANSKLLANAQDKKVADKVLLPEVFNIHALLHDNSARLCQQLAADLNSDFPSLFNEKKYKEL